MKPQSKPIWGEKNSTCEPLKTIKVSQHVVKRLTTYHIETDRIVGFCTNKKEHMIKSYTEARKTFSLGKKIKIISLFYTDIFRVLQTIVLAVPSSGFQTFGQRGINAILVCYKYRRKSLRN